MSSVSGSANNDSQAIKDPDSDASLLQWLDYLLSIHPTEIEMGLTRVTEVAKRLEVLNPDSTVVTVAGTNGKGTTCAMIESVLLQAGKTVGVYSSPHLEHFNERVRLNHQDVSDQQLICAFQAIEHARTQSGLAEISLSFFEYATLAGLYIFKQQKPDVILLEVGLGGRLDATNIIDADVTVITSIDIDHQEYLGDTRELVGREKAGIFRSNRLAVIGEPDLPSTVLEYAAEINAKVYQVNQDFSYHLNGDTWQFSGRDTAFNKLVLPKLPLANAVTAIAVIEQTWPSISAEQITKGIATASLSGRLEQVLDKPVVLVDVAHNPHAAKYLASQLHQYKPTRIIALCGMLKDKDASAVLAQLTDTVDEWYFTSLDVERGLDAQTLASQLANSGTNKAKSSQFDSIEQAWQGINANINPDDVVIVFGSFYTVAGFSKILERE
ncbi:bifunctional tetrahydrofolate synthase/dihydrofolate synthase [Shewanella olleyana]|uniref:bifunctional tetrahydrofolate synthase/dihydrofolate synthase n=1 Tax=Shewanella olleyana TaxID=135626 RepID=UPI00200C9096|nr:bifunctional tetrahydrofolate synthase/dihydrofolate synthase [Shewanella olleyana]MCL1065233.1 bifunctional tetrahydrofolate synthase/dihydrofolate synthase [Shewanella olleyana]